MLTEIRQELARAAKIMDRKGGPIAIVEDDSDDQLMLWREVKFLFGDVPVKTFGDGAQLMNFIDKEKKTAKEDFRAHKPRMILLDLNMPKMDGFKTLKKLQKEKATADIPVVIVSGTRSDDDIVKAKAAGAYAFLSKPFSRDAWVFF